MRERKRRIFNQGFSGSFNLGKSSIVLASIGLLVMLGLLFLSQSNAIALKGYSLSDLEKRKTALQEEKQRLEIEATRLQSLQELTKTTTQPGTVKYVPVQKINYLPSSNVAVR